MHSLTMLTAGAELLAENNFGDKRSGGLAGPIGLLIILLLAAATILLIRNMNRRLRRLPDRFPDTQRPDTQRPDTQRPDTKRHENSGDDRGDQRAPHDAS